MRWGPAPQTAHPRACGENMGEPVTRVRKTGSSPRVRGKLVEQDVGGAGVGLIPARAGKTRSCPRRGAARTAHPRACGENITVTDRDKQRAGSSPRVRGKLAEKRALTFTDGLIPARAGKTGDASSPTPPPSAHPRACGENAHHARAVYAPAGSSPRVRGKRGHDIAVAHDGRLIPARAGKTRRTSFIGCPLRAHPRACGENSEPRTARCHVRGSSPRVRGKHHWRHAVSRL